MNFTIDRVRPLLSYPLLPPQEQTVILWLAAISALLGERYGDKLTPAREAFVLVYVGDAISRRLDPSHKPGLLSQSVGSARAQWSDKLPLGGWFLPGELEEMDNMCGIGGSRAVRLTSDFGDRRSWRPYASGYYTDPSEWSGQ